MKRRILLGSLALLVVASIAILAFILIPRSAPVADAAEREVVERLVVTGQVTPAGRTAVSAEVTSRVEAVPVEEGDVVEAGDILVQLDDEEGRRSLEEATAGVEEARARLQSVDERGASTALEELRRASLALEAAIDEYERARQLLDAGITTRAEVDERRREVERAESGVDSAQAVYEEATDDGSGRAEAAAGLARAEAGRRLARIRLDDYTIRASQDATILTRDVEPGAGVQPGTVVATVDPDGPVDLRLTPDERELANLEAGQPALVTTDAYPDRQFDAVVHRIAPSVDAERGTIAVDVRVDDPPDYLRPDMTVTADIEIDRRDEALVVPRVAIRDLATDTPSVLRIDDRRAVETRVDVGLESDEYVEIVDGLDAGDTVVASRDVEPGDRIRHGDEYTPDEDSPDDDAPGDPDLPEPPRAANTTAFTGGGAP